MSHQPVDPAEVRVGQRYIVHVQVAVRIISHHDQWVGVTPVAALPVVFNVDALHPITGSKP